MQYAPAAAAQPPRPPSVLEFVAGLHRTWTHEELELGVSTPAARRVDADEARLLAP